MYDLMMSDLVAISYESFTFHPGSSPGQAFDDS